MSSNRDTIEELRIVEFDKRKLNEVDFLKHKSLVI